MQKFLLFFFSLFNLSATTTVRKQRKPLNIQAFSFLLHDFKSFSSITHGTFVAFQLWNQTLGEMWFKNLKICRRWDFCLTFFEKKGKRKRESCIFCLTLLFPLMCFSHLFYDFSALWFRIIFCAFSE